MAQGVLHLQSLSAAQKENVAQEKELLAVALRRLNGLRKEVQIKSPNCVKSAVMDTNAWETEPFSDAYFDMVDQSQMHFVKTPQIRAYFLYKPSTATWIYMERHASGQNTCYVTSRDLAGIPSIQTFN